MNTLSQQIKQLSLIYFLLTVVVSIFVIIFSLLNARSISKPIIAASEFSRIIAGGELETAISGKIIKRKDEIGTLCNDLEIMRLSMKKELEKIKYQSQKSNFLFQELYHRTKNNLHLVLAFISLEFERDSIVDFRKSLENVKNRIYILSSVQDMIYSDEDINDMKIADFLSEIIRLLKQEYKLPDNKIKFSINADSSRITKHNMVSAGFLINELFSNIMMYFDKELDSNNLIIEVFHDEITDNIIMIIKLDYNTDLTLEEVEKLSNKRILKALSEGQLNGKCSISVTDEINYRFDFEEI